MAAFDGCSGRAEKPVSGGGDLKAVREELKSGGVERMPAQEKEEIPDQMLDFLFQMEQE